MSNPVGGVGESPEEQWTAANESYKQAMIAMTDDLIFFHDLLEDIVKRVNTKGQKISTDQAYQNLVPLSGGMIQSTGDKAGVEGATQGLGSVGTNVMNQATSMLSAMQGPNSPLQDSVDFCKGIKNIYDVAKAQLALPKGDPKKWMDNSTATSMIKAVDAIWGMFGGSTSNPPSASTVWTTIRAWVNPPQGTPPSEGLENLQQLAGQLGSMSAGFSSLTSIQSGLMQNTMAQVTQMLNVMRGTMMSIISSIMQLIKNQTAG